MNVLPVIIRELRVEARNPFTHWLRVGGGALVLAVMWYQTTITTLFMTDLGGWLFGRLHVGVFLAIWVLVPLLAADCISRERREGTLGLLFLTPLRPFDIVTAKGFVHGLRSLTIWLAVLPVLTVPLLLGGVTWQLTAAAALINFASICWALSAGLMASSICKVRNRALVLAALLACFFLLINGAAMRSSFPRTIGSGWLPETVLITSAPRIFLSGNFVYLPPGAMPGPVVRSAMPEIFSTLRLAGFSVVALLTALLVAASGVRRGTREEPPSQERQALEAAFFTPRFGVSLLNRWLRSKLNRNPIGWLEQRRWSVRLISWSWLAIIASLLSMALYDTSTYRGWASSTNMPMGWLLVASLAVTTAGSFRRERESGVMELLLVSPLSVRQIIGGRLRGLWMQFLPAFGVLLGSWAYLAGLFNSPAEFLSVFFFGVTFLTLPVIGLYFSLQRPSFFGALAWTAVVALVLPMTLPAMVFGPLLGGHNALSYAFVNLPGLSIGTPVLTPLIQLALAAFFYRRMAQRLEHRSFPLEHT